MVEFDRRMMADWLQTVCARQWSLLATLAAILALCLHLPRLARGVFKR
jgi:hypothetical protein